MSKNVSLYSDLPIAMHVQQVDVPYSELTISAALYLNDDSADPTSSTLGNAAALIDQTFNVDAVTLDWSYSKHTPTLGLGYADGITAWDEGALSSVPALIDTNTGANGQQALWYEVVGLDLGSRKSVKRLIVYDWNSPAGTGGALDAGWNDADIYTSDDNITWTKVETVADVSRAGGGPTAVGTTIIELSKEYTARYFAVYTGIYPWKKNGNLLTSYSEVEAYEGVVDKWSVGVDLGVGGQLANQIELYDYTTTGGEGLDWSGINGSLALYKSDDNAIWTYVETFLAMSRPLHKSDIYIIAVKFKDAVTSRYFKLYCSAGALRTAELIPVVPSEIRVFTVPDTLTETTPEFELYFVEAGTTIASKRVL